MILLFQCDLIHACVFWQNWKYGLIMVEGHYVIWKSGWIWIELVQDVVRRVLEKGGSISSWKDTWLGDQKLKIYLLETTTLRKYIRLSSKTQNHSIFKSPDINLDSETEQTHDDLHFWKLNSPDINQSSLQLHQTMNLLP